jgi:hypothetical protein
MQRDSAAFHQSRHRGNHEISVHNKEDQMDEPAEISTNMIQDPA